MFARRGHLTLAHNDSSLRTMRWRAEVNKLEGVDSEVIGPEEIKGLVPYMESLTAPATRSSERCTTRRAGSSATTPSTGATPAPQTALGVEIHQITEVLGIGSTRPGERGATSRGRHLHPARRQLHRGLGEPGRRDGRRATADRHPPLQAAVTEPVKMFLHAVVVSGSLHVYVSQTDRGELVFGASTDPYASYSMRGSLEFTEELATQSAADALDRQAARPASRWAGLCDITPDFSPIMGVTAVEGFLVDVGWGTYGFKAGPAARRGDGALAATGDTPELIAAFDLARFSEGQAGRGKGRPRSGTDKKENDKERH